MKRDHGLQALLGWTLGLCATAAMATADGPDHFVVRDVRAGEMLNIRAAPSAQARKVGAIPAHGTCIRNLGCQGGLTLQEFTTLTPAQRKQRERENPRWCRVEYQGATGWVSARFVGEGACPG